VESSLAIVAEAGGCCRAEGTPEVRASQSLDYCPAKLAHMFCVANASTVVAMVIFVDQGPIVFLEFFLKIK
jgi:hypothetical protein